MEYAKDAAVAAFEREYAKHLAELGAAARELSGPQALADEARGYLAAHRPRRPVLVAGAWPTSRADLAAACGAPDWQVRRLHEQDNSVAVPLDFLRRVVALAERAAETDPGDGVVGD